MTLGWEGHRVRLVPVLGEGLALGLRLCLVSFDWLGVAVSPVTIVIKLVLYFAAEGKATDCPCKHFQSSLNISE